MEPYRWVVDRAVVSLNPENLPIGELTKDIRKKLLEALMGKIRCSTGLYSLSDILRHNAVQIAESFQTSEIKLKY